jgi:hypothetical protein
MVNGDEPMIKFLKNILTARDNDTFSLSKIIAIGGGFAMIGEFLYKGSVDFQGFGIGITTIIGSLAAKYYVEK